MEGEETTQKRANTATNHHHRSARYSGGFPPHPSLPHRRRSPSYNLLVNFASLLEGYVRWDKKYPEWYPPFAVPSPPSPPCLPRAGTVAAFVLSPFFACAMRTSISNIASTSSSTNTSGSSSNSSRSADRPPRL